jgi:hypothetical protein
MLGLVIEGSSGVDAKPAVLNETRAGTDVPALVILAMKIGYLPIWTTS